MSRHELTTEDRRRGAQRSAEVRRRKRDRGWHDAFLELVDQAPDEVAGPLLRSGNAMALVMAIEIAEETKDASLRRREAELDEREKQIREAQRELRDMEGSRADFDEWHEQAQAIYDSRQAEIVELERQRNELRLAIEREANAHDLEWVAD